MRRRCKRDVHERRHRRTDRHPECVLLMASADFRRNMTIKLDHTDAGYHATVIHSMIGDDDVMHVTDSYASPEQAVQAAQHWLEKDQWSFADL